MKASRDFSWLASRAQRALSIMAISSLVSAFSVANAVLLEGCSSDASATSGQRVVLHTRLELASDATQFTTAFGWNVTLTQAVISGGPLYYFDGAPPLVMSEPSPNNWKLAQRLLGVSEARAHPGHYATGNALGQMLEAWSANLFETPIQLADGDGITGTYRSAALSFSAPPTGAAAAALGNHVAVVMGHAEMPGAEPRYFVANAGLAEIEKSVGAARVDGCEFEQFKVTGNGTVTLSVHPQVWFDLVDFGELAPGSLAAPTEFAPNSQPRIAFTQGLAELSAYSFSFQPE
ncbi:MAG: hypothetical protein ACOY0T_38015 [Myxococcota bacterium]